MLWLDMDAIDDDSMIANAPALWWTFEFATFYYETGSCGVVTKQNPYGLKRARLGIPLYPPVPRAKYKEHVTRIAQFIADHTGLPIDVPGSARLFLFTGPRPSEAAPPRIVDWTPGYALDLDKFIEYLDKFFPQLPPAPVVAPAPKPRRAPAGRYNPHALVENAPSQAQKIMANAPRGSRHNTVVREVYGLAQLCNQGLSTEEIMRVAQAGCEANGLWKDDRKACLLTIKSTIKAGLRKPRPNPVKVLYDVVALREQALSRARAHGLKPREDQLVREIVAAHDVVKGYSIIARETLAERTGLDVRTVARMVKRLEARGVVVVTHTKIQRPDKPASSWNAPNKYRIV